MNTVKDNLKAGKVVVGTGAGVDPIAAGLLGDTGFDFLLFDTQHSTAQPKELAPAIAALKGKKASPVVRVGDNRADLPRVSVPTLVLQCSSDAIASEPRTGP